MNSQKYKASLVKYGLITTAIGGYLFTFDIPLLRLSEGEKGTLIIARGVLLFVSITVAWLIMRRRSAVKLPYIAGWAGAAVVITNMIANISYISALTESNAANVVFILALVPVLTAVFSRVFINEYIHPFTWLATLMAVVGVSIIVGDSLSLGRGLGDFLALVCAICTAAAFTIIRASGKNVATSLALGSLLSAILAFVYLTYLSDTPFSMAGLGKTAGYGMPSWFWIALNGLIIVPFSSSLIANGPRFLPSADVSMFFLLETILTPIWIFMLFGEQPTKQVLIGGAIVISTLVVHSIWRLQQTLTDDGRERA